MLEVLQIPGNHGVNVSICTRHHLLGECYPYEGLSTWLYDRELKMLSQQHYWEYIVSQLIDPRTGLFDPDEMFLQQSL